MSYGTHNMVSTGTSQTMSVSLANEHLPQMLRQVNYLGADQNKYLGSVDMHTANVNFRVVPHVESAAPRMTVSRELHELYPTQSASAKQQLSDHEHDWSKHEIVASVAGLHTKLAELDSEIRTGAVADAQGVGVMRHVQDHATLLGVHAKLVAETQSKHKQTAALTHKICSQMHDNAQLQSTELDACQDDIAKLKSKHTASVGLVHDICSELQKGLVEHGEDRQSLQLSLGQQKAAISLLQQKDVVAQALLSKMLTMLDQHESFVSNGKPLSRDHLALLDSMCLAFEKTKRKMQTFEQTQQDMHQVIADFKANKLPPAGAYATEALQAKLDRYERMSTDIDAQCRQALAQHGAKMEDMQRTHQQALQLHGAKMQELERKVAATQSEHRKIAELEGRVQELALQQLNSSQSASISRVAERDVKLLQRDMNQMHSYKKDVDAANNNVSSLQADMRKLQIDNKARTEHTLSLHAAVESMRAATNTNVSTMQADLRKMQLEQQAGAGDKSTAEMHSKILDVQRNQTLQNIRLDKTATTVHEIQCRLAA
jgi:hypothetical protein